MYGIQDRPKIHFFLSDRYKSRDHVLKNATVPMRGFKDLKTQFFVLGHVTLSMFR